MKAAVPEVLLFDVFGTLVDWRSSLIRALEEFGKTHAIECDWPAFVDAWRAAYVPSMERVRSGARPWANLDALHGESFDALAGSFRLPALDEWDRDWIVCRWHELDPWPEVREALERLRSRYIVATLSNGNLSLQLDLTRFAGLRFDALFSAEFFRHYKPDAQAYLGATALLGREPAQVMLVAAHNDDLQAAASYGLRTAFVARRSEYGPQQQSDLDAAEGIDLAARDLAELADLLRV